MSKILYNDKPEIGLSELSNIYLALISLADIIYINKDIKISSHLDIKIHKHIDDNIEYLKDEGLLKIWTWPHMTPSLNSPDLAIFPEQDYLFWSKLINETFLQGNNLTSIFDIANAQYGVQKQIREERSSKIVAIKKEYMTFAICCALKLDQILNNYGQYQTDWSKTDYIKYSRQKKPLIKKIFSSYGIPPLWPLMGKDVKKLHNQNMDFRAVIDIKALQIGTKQYTTNKAFEDISSILFNFLDERISENFKSKLASFLMNVLGLYFTPASFIPNVNDTITELSNRKKFGFVYFMSNIKKMSQKRSTEISI